MAWIKQPSNPGEKDMWWNNATNQYTDVAPSDTEQFLGRFAALRPAGYESTGGFDSYIRGLQGITGEDLNNALNKAIQTNGWERFNADTGQSTGQDAALANISGLADQERIKLLGTAFDSLGKDTGWKNLYNADTAAKQQGAVTARNDLGKRQYEASSGIDWGGIASGLGLVLGAGALGGAFGGSGLFGGADVIGSDFAAGVGGSLGGVPADIAMSAATAGGTTAPTWTSGADLPGVDSGLMDASWGVNPQAGGTVTGSGGGNMFDVGGADWMDEIAAGAGNGGSTLPNYVPTDPYSSTTTENILGSTGSDWATGGGYGNITPAQQEALNNITISGGSPDYVGSDWASGGANVGSGNVMTPGLPEGGGGIWNQIKSQLSSLPTGTQNAVKALLSGGGAAGSAGSALSRVLSGSGTAADWTSVLGTAGTGILSAVSANKYADTMKELADRSWNAGSDYRNRLASTYTNPGAYLDSPEVKAITDRATNALSRSLSARDGNPIGSGRALNEINDYAGQTMLGQLGNYRQQLANFGGQSQLSGNYGQLGSQSAEAGSNIYNSLANTTSRLTAPETDWAKLFQSFGFAPNVKPVG